MSLGSLVVAKRNGAITKKSLGLAQRQEERRSAVLDIRLVSATCSIRGGVRTYIYDLIIRNPSDRGSAVAQADVLLEYVVGGRPVTVKVPWKPGHRDDLPGELVLPITIAANSAAAGSLQISVTEDLVGPHSVERVRLILSDSFSTEFTVTSEFVQEQVSEESDD